MHLTKNPEVTIGFSQRVVVWSNKQFKVLCLLKKTEREGVTSSVSISLV